MTVEGNRREVCESATDDGFFRGGNNGSFFE
jgi:hypothetical protein